MKKEKAIKKIRKQLLKIRKIYLSYLDEAFCTEEDKEKGYLSLCMFRDYITFSSHPKMSEDIAVAYYEFLRENKD